MNARWFVMLTQKNKWRLFVGVAWFILLSSCSMHHPWTMMSSPAVKQCQAACIKQHKICQTKCTDNCPSCSLSATKEARKHYKQYVHEELVEGNLITRDLQSYRDPLKCRKTSCNCYTDLMTCQQSCTGIIQKQLRPAPYCV